MICSSLIFAQPEAGFIVERRECVRCLLQGLPVRLQWALLSDGDSIQECMCCSHSCSCCWWQQSMTLQHTKSWSEMECEKCHWTLHSSPVHGKLRYPFWLYSTCQPISIQQLHMPCASHLQSGSRRPAQECISHGWKPFSSLSDRKVYADGHVCRAINPT